MVEKCVALSKNEVPWSVWQTICVKFNLDPFKTKNILLYVSRIACPAVKDLIDEERSEKI